ncbi:MAG: amino acid-binding protein [Candidatus Aureabacteria bacterium]|nr:amino acid-binding protein [Candidatus Auribacterota bacterium]
MKRVIALTAIGRDRPGIVAEVTRILFARGSNIEDSSMTILRGEFAMILIISLQDSQEIDALDHDLKRMACRMSLFVALKEIEPVIRTRPLRRGRSYIISLLGSDKAGIVYRVSRLLASRGVNITDLDTRLIGTRRSPVYAMVIEAEVPPRLAIGRLSADLKKLADKMNVTVTLKPLESVEL